MLEDMATVGDESIVSWQPHGKAFRVHQPKVFARTAMPQYFKQQTKYKSFQRQLHLYGFHRIKKGMDAGAYFHTMFTRDNKSMCLRMSYEKIKGNKAVGDHAAGDLNFYSSETNVDNKLTNALQSDRIPHTPFSTTTITKDNKKRDCKKRGLTTIVTAGSISGGHHFDVEKLSLLNSPLHFDREAPGAGPSPSHQVSDWMEQAHTVLSSCVEEHHVTPHNAGDAALRRANYYNKHDDAAGFFEGKKFYYVAETITPMMEDSSAVVNRAGWPRPYNARSA